MKKIVLFVFVFTFLSSVSNAGIGALVTKRFHNQTANKIIDNLGEEYIDFGKNESTDYFQYIFECSPLKGYILESTQKPKSFSLYDKFTIVYSKDRSFLKSYDKLSPLIVITNAKNMLSFIEYKYNSFSIYSVNTSNMDLSFSKNYYVNGELKRLSMSSKCKKI